jgi:enamine deaminase RidA (YjgF/YER057c/UK114 family)
MPSKIYNITLNASNIKATVEQAYRELFDTLKNSEYTYINKIWNFVPNIHTNYSEFNLARKTIFTESGYEEIPVAVGIGSNNNNFELNFELGDVKPIIIDNKNQVQPKDYSTEYGNTPLFSRAALINNLLYISGTASILHEKTTSQGDIKGQTETTLLNIMTIIDSYNKLTNKKLQPNDLFYTVYLPDDENIYGVVEVLEKILYPENVAFFKNDLCRKDLLVEIEAREKS